MKKLKKRLNILVTAGPTREPIDPIRFISNYATGFLGYQIAKDAHERGHRVILISGPTLLAKPKSVRSIDVVTARQMQKEVQDKFAWCDCLVMSAAVGDFRASKKASSKIKKGKSPRLVLELEQNPDILRGLGPKRGRRLVVGFALETEALKQNALTKLREKNLDLIVATLMRPDTYPFGKARMSSLIIEKTGRARQFKRATKAHLARILLDSIEKSMLS